MLTLDDLTMMMPFRGAFLTQQIDTTIRVRTLTLRPGTITRELAVETTQQIEVIPATTREERQQGQQRQEAQVPVGLRLTWAVVVTTTDAQIPVTEQGRPVRRPTALTQQLFTELTRMIQTRMVTVEVTRRDVVELQITRLRSLTGRVFGQAAAPRRLPVLRLTAQTTRLVFQTEVGRNVDMDALRERSTDGMPETLMRIFTPEQGPEQARLRTGGGATRGMLKLRAMRTPGLSLLAPETETTLL